MKFCQGGMHALISLDVLQALHCVQFTFTCARWLSATMITIATFVLCQTWHQALACGAAVATAQLSQFRLRRHKQ